MTVHFIGAGPGAADLITVRGQRLLSQCPVCLYAGSTVATELLEYCPPGARLINTAALDLEAIELEYVRAHQNGEAVARLHSGDLSVYSALAEQLRRLKQRGIDYTLTPGVPAFAAAAALIERELTVPEVAQSVVLTRLSGRASKMPEREQLERFADTGATLAIHLAIHRLEEIVTRLTPFYGADCPVAVVYRASWPEERMVQGVLGDIVERLAADPIERSALILVGQALGDSDFRDSALYETGYCRRFRHGEGIEALTLPDKR
ncbi:precorrin-4 C(11)-methyltransferase [Kushneria phyllosphaerae]|uniref:Precorrin-4 C(11)-methyltransferase n=1 Tax=Kushneria phyllosphaerae TaxID=2100822 RepID=A0A2R8CJR5_9GAMM|nr:precorrin-4 C(11)-methyltransferase [Kushneria phyllosphaerae]SPJ33062.1 Precorrin-4 C(11)-methyltransferase [Kushneria phyllosphaerae]